jgi:hypothetical protein
MPIRSSIQGVRLSSGFNMDMPSTLPRDYDLVRSYMHLVRFKRFGGRTADDLAVDIVEAVVARAPDSALGIIELNGAV